MKKNLLPATVIGIDLGDLRHVVCVIDKDGEPVEECSITNTRESLTKIAKKYPGARIAIEVGTHSPWISRLLTELGCEVIVANPRKLRAIYQNERKSDLLDARMLAKLARADVSLLHPVQHGSEQAQRDLLRIKQDRGQATFLDIFDFECRCQRWCMESSKCNPRAVQKKNKKPVTS